jgi:hypothetical protein
MKDRPIIIVIAFLFFIALMPGITFLNAQNYKNIEALKRRTASVGKLRFKENIEVRYLNKTRLTNYIGSLFDKEYSPQLAQKEATFIRLMGYVNRHIDIRSARKRILLENVGGVYNEKTKELLALDSYRHIDYINSMILIHELRHAVQDGHFNLTEKLAQRNFSDLDDRKLALLAAIEGDASFVMVQCGELDAGVLTSSDNAEALLSFTPAPKPALLYREPDIIKHLLLMPYIDGLRFVNGVFKKKRWRGVNRILKRPPISTEQVLHPIKYLKKEYPIEVNIDYQPQGLQLYHSGVVGEFLLNVLLKAVNQDTIFDAAQGWGGDYYHIFLDKENNTYFFIWEAIWDKEVFCSHFYSDFKRFLGKRFNFNFKNGSVNDTPFVAGQSGSDYFFIMKEEDRLFYVRTNDRKQMNTFIYGGNYD